MFSKNLNRLFSVVLIVVGFVFNIILICRKEIYEKNLRKSVCTFEQKIPQFELYKNPPVLE